MPDVSIFDEYRYIRPERESTGWAVSNIWESPFRSGQPVDPGGGVVEQGCLFTRREVMGEAFESVPQHGVGTRYLVHREVAFKHAPVWAKLLDAM